MKAGTVEHVKFKRLQRRLGLSLFECVGILESIWMLTARSHFRGDIGSSHNIDIAYAIGWDKDEDELINALIETGWLDEHQTHRLVVHDWDDHCPKYVKGNIAKYGAIKEPRILLSLYEPPIGDSLKERPKPSQAKPSQANSINLPAEAWRIADLIVENVKALNPKAKNITVNLDKTKSSWASDVEKLNRIDGREWEEIERVMKWVMEDSFWSQNILSGKKLREQYDRLVIKINAKNIVKPMEVA